MAKVKVAAIGAGNRMNAYSEYALRYPEEVEIVAVVEPNLIRRENYRHRFGIPEKNCFTSWETFLELPRKADALFLCTPDDLHFEPAIKALEKGYHVLLEKPIARKWEECVAIVAKAKELDRIVGVCHVLRYHPYYSKLKEILEKGRLGEIISVHHVEAVGIERMTHAFVRGLWRKEEEANPMILSKACHDLDLLVWLTGRKCVDVSSYGSLKWFCKANAPEGSKKRCIEGCLIEKECPFSALELYYRQRRWLRHFDIPEGEDPQPFILRELREGPYGRCVYHCDNDVVDHQVVSMLMEGQITVNFSMEGFTKNGGRKTHVMCSKGEIMGDEKMLTVRYFHSEIPDETYDFSAYSGECNFHGGADLNIVAGFIQAVREGNADFLRTDIEASLESHRIAFEIEQKRRRDRFGK